MITIRSLIIVNDALVAMEDFAGPIRDQDYIEGAIELWVGSTCLLSREQVDLVDQLWCYLVDGLVDVVAGRSFSTFYPDMPVEVTLQPRGRGVTMKVNAGKRVAEATMRLDDLRGAMVPAGRLFFEKLRPFGHRATCDRYLARLATLS
jgi:hypothetical protein